MPRILGYAVNFFFRAILRQLAGHSGSARENVRTLLRASCVMRHVLAQSGRHEIGFAGVCRSATCAQSNGLTGGRRGTRRGGGERVKGCGVRAGLCVA